MSNYSDPQSPNLNIVPDNVTFNAERMGELLKALNWHGDGSTDMELIQVYMLRCLSNSVCFFNNSH